MHGPTNIFLIYLNVAFIIILEIFYLHLLKLQNIEEHVLAGAASRV